MIEDVLPECNGESVNVCLHRRDNAIGHHVHREKRALDMPTKKRWQGMNLECHSKSAQKKVRECTCKRSPCMENCFSEHVGHSKWVHGQNAQILGNDKKHYKHWIKIWTEYMCLCFYVVPTMQIIWSPFVFHVMKAAYHRRCVYVFLGYGNDGIEDTTVCRAILKPGVV